MGKAEKISIVVLSFIAFLLSSFFSYAAIKHNIQREFSNDYPYYIFLGHFNLLFFL